MNLNHPISDHQVAPLEEGGASSSLRWEVIAQFPDQYQGPVCSTLEAHGVTYSMSPSFEMLIECQLYVAHDYALTVCRAIAHAVSPKSAKAVKIWLMPL